MSDSKVMRCPFCRRLYKTYSMMVGDQSCCPACRIEAEKNMGERPAKWVGACNPKTAQQGGRSGKP